MQLLVKNKKFILVSLIATILSVFFAFIGTPVLRVLHRAYGSLAYWLTGFVISGLLFFIILISTGFGLASALGFFPNVILFISIWLTIGIYCEFENKGRANFWTFLISILIGSLVLMLVPQLYFKSMGFDFNNTLKLSIEDFLNKVTTKEIPVDQTWSSFKLDANFLYNQIPSMVVLIFMIALSFALILAEKTAVLFGVAYERIASELRPLEFKVPEGLIWLTMLSFLLSYIKKEPTSFSIYSMNIFNVLMGFYLFQGLAVLEVFFLIFKVGRFVKFFIYFIIVGQLFFLLSIVGVIDFWVDFRKRLKKYKSSEIPRKDGE